jgi:hypothetical protein
MTAAAVEPTTPSSVEPATATMKPSSTTAVEASAIAASVEAVSTMKPVSAAEAFTTMEPSAAVEALVPVEFTAAIPSAFPTKSAATAEPITVTVPTATAVVAATVEAMEPGPCANEHAAVKVIRPVIAIWCAHVWRILIVAIGAYWRRPNVGWAKLNCDLRMGGPSPCYDHKKPDQYSAL